MSRAPALLALFVLCACDPAKPAAAPAGAPAKAEPTKSPPAKAEPAKAEPNNAEPASPPKGDPILLKICKAFDDVVAENKGQEQLLARAAVRATELGVTEPQLEALGPQPPQLLASIRARGNPPECAAFTAYLEALQ